MRRMLTFNLGLFVRKMAPGCKGLLSPNTAGASEGSGRRGGEAGGGCDGRGADEVPAPSQEAVSHGRDGRPGVVRLGHFKIRS